MKKLLLLLLIPVVAAACAKVQYTPVVDYHPAKGPANAQFKIVEWSDFQCPFCGQAYEQLAPVFDKYRDRINLTYRHFPLNSIHPLAFGAATASECAADQNKFWEYHDVLFEHQPNFKKKDLIGYAQQLGLDVTLFENCFDSKVKNEVVKADLKEGESLGVKGTPTFYVNGQSVPWTDIAAILDQAFATTTKD